MARDIPTDQPLSDEDRQYLLDRGLEHRVAQIDAATETDWEPEEVTPEGSLKPGTLDLATLEAQREAERSALGASPDAEVDDRPYEEWKPAELKAELAARKLPTNGSKGDLVARLQADDEDTSAEGEGQE